VTPEGRAYVLAYLYDKRKNFTSTFGCLTPNKNYNLVHLKVIFPLTSDLNVG
jgi:hypothetical protein